MIIILVKYTYQTTHTSTPSSIHITKRIYILYRWFTKWWRIRNPKNTADEIYNHPSTTIDKSTQTNKKRQSFQTRIQESSDDNSSSMDNELSDSTTSNNSAPSNIHPTYYLPNFTNDTTFTNLSVSILSTDHITNSKTSSKPSPLI